jgi:hypothetical protein
MYFYHFHHSSPIQDVLKIFEVICPQQSAHTLINSFTNVGTDCAKAFLTAPYEQITRRIQMDREIKKNLKEAKVSAKKAITKAQATAVKNAKTTAREVLKDIEPEVAKIKTDIKNAVKSFRKRLA